MSVSVSPVPDAAAASCLIAATTLLAVDGAGTTSAVMAACLRFTAPSASVIIANLRINKKI
jgi:hypothetical protein